MLCIMAYLENNLIKLRALEPEDLDVLYRWENDTELWDIGVTLSPYSKYALREYIAKSRKDIYQSRQLRLMITLKENGDPIGTIDLYDFDPVNSKAAIGILLDKPFRGRGFGSQALELICGYAFDFLSLKQLYAFVPVRNIPSIKLFTRCGYQPAGTLIAWLKTKNGFDDVYLMQLIHKDR